MPLDSRVLELINHIVPPLLEMYETEDNKCVFFFCLDALHPVLRLRDENFTQLTSMPSGYETHHYYSDLSCCSLIDSSLTAFLSFLQAFMTVTV